MLRKRHRWIVAAGQQERKQPRQVGKVAGQQDVPLFAAQPVANPRRRVVRLQIARGGKFGERVAGTPEHFRCLPCAQLAAMPDGRRLHSPRRGIGCRSLHRLAAVQRERAARIDIRPDGVAMMNEKEVQPRG